MSFFFGGDKRDRTADLMTASHALSQLSYTPIAWCEGIISQPKLKCKHFFRNRKNIFPDQKTVVSRSRRKRALAVSKTGTVLLQPVVQSTRYRLRCT